jgi:hypothetical protein
VNDLIRIAAEDKDPAIAEDARKALLALGSVGQRQPPAETGKPEK